METTSSPDRTRSETKPLTIEVYIQGIDEPVIYEYFARLNNGEFIATAELFAAQGVLNPPFDHQLQGRAAIAQYLEEQAQGIIFAPAEGEISIGDSNHTQYQIQGQVEMNWFTVNISWSIQLNAAKEIMLVEVKLLTDLDDLLSFSRI
jgi:hypothetical protein